MQNEHLATKLFTDRTSAEREYDALVARGYSAEDVNVVMTEEGRKRHFGDGTPRTELGNKALEGAGVDHLPHRRPPGNPARGSYFFM
jgi:hypothetical protein